MKRILNGFDSDYLESFLSEEGTKSFKIKKQVSFHLYTTHTPCGDASIFPKANDPESKDAEDVGAAVDASNFVSLSKRKLDNPEDVSGVKKSKMDDSVNNDRAEKIEEADAGLTGDIHRTGAKCVPGGEQDSCGEGSCYHTVGVLRTKPGRGERTLSLSCSDKMAKWNIVGMQGALLTLLLKTPVYLSSVIVGR